MTSFISFTLSFMLLLGSLLHAPASRPTLADSPKNPAALSVAHAPVPLPPARPFFGHLPWQIAGPMAYGTGFVEAGPESIQFSMQCDKRQIAIGDEVNLTVTAELLAVAASQMFFVPGSNAYTLKILLPPGFEQTGGNFTDYAIGTLSPATQSRMTYHISGHFRSVTSGTSFRLLSSHGQANDQSLFAERAVINLQTVSSGNTTAKFRETAAAPITPTSSTLYVVAESSTPGVSKATTPNYKGYLERADCELIKGWIVDVNDFNKSQAVDIYVNGIKAATIQADQPRRDVANTFEKIGFIRYGFVWIISDYYKANVPLTISVRPAETSLDISQSPAETGVCPGTGPAPVDTPPAATTTTPPVTPTATAGAPVGKEGSDLTMLAPTYNCATGAIIFNTSGGNGTTIRYRAPGITGWTTNPSQTLDAGSHIYDDTPPFTIYFEQSGKTFTYTWSRQAACAGITPSACVPPPAPSLSAQGGTQVCDNSTITLTAAGCAGTITWSGGQTGTSLGVKTAGTYTATCTLNGCTSTSSNQLTITPCPPPSTGGGRYNRVLYVGNSITLHGGNPFFIVSGQNPRRGMAATAPNKDYVRLMSARHRLQNPAVDNRTIASWNLGGQLDEATGPYWESQSTKGGIDLSRFDPIAAWKPDLVYVRLGENVADGEITNPSLYENRLKELVDKLISQSPGAKVVLSTSVWDKPNYDKAIRAVAAERNYPLADFSDMWPNRSTNGYFALTDLNSGPRYGDAGTDAHPDDDGMKRIADNLWSKTPGNTPLSAPASAPAPPSTSRKYDYPTVPAGTNSGWNGYNPAMSSGALEPGRVVGDVAIMEDDNIKIEIRRGYGGAVQIFDKTTQKYIFNWFDWGRQSELCLYGGPKNFNLGKGGDAFSDIGFNPIVQGNIRNVPSIIEASGFVTGNDNVRRHYTKIHMIQWASGLPGTQNPPVYTDAWLEKWVGLLPNGAVDVKTRVRFNRKDQTFYDGSIAGEGITQEYPNMMTISNNTTNYYYTGPAPYTNDQNGTYFKSTNTKETPTKAFDGTTFTISEPWTAVQFQPGRFVFLSTERFAQAGSTLFVPEAGDSDGEFTNPGTYTSNMVPLIMDPNGEWYHDYAFLVANNLQTGRTWANARPQVHGQVPDWRFSKENGRNGWTIGKGFDQREPFAADNWQPTFRVIDGTTRNGELASPFVIHIANKIPKLYLRLKYAGPVTRWRIEFLRNGQRNRGLDADKPNEMRARYPNGAANMAAQILEFSVQNDGQFHTIEIPTTGREWRDVIQQYVIKYGSGQQAPSQADKLEISYFGVNNPGN